MRQSERQNRYVGLIALEGELQELDGARRWFEWVTDPCAVDEAILRLGAAELRLSRAMQPPRSAWRWARVANRGRGGVAGSSRSAGNGVRRQLAPGSGMPPNVPTG